MTIIVQLLAVYGLAFFVKNTDGPWGIMAWIRNILLRNKYTGVFFYNLLDCYMCLGSWCGLAIYLLSAENYKLADMPIYALTGGAVCVILDAVLTWLHSNAAKNN